MSLTEPGILHEVLEAESRGWQMTERGGCISIRGTLIPWEAWLEEKETWNQEGEARLGESPFGTGIILAGQSVLPREREETKQNKTP